MYIIAQYYRSLNNASENKSVISTFPSCFPHYVLRYFFFQTNTFITQFHGKVLMILCSLCAAIFTYFVIIFPKISPVKISFRIEPKHHILVRGKQLCKYAFIISNNSRTHFLSLTPELFQYR